MFQNFSAYIPYLMMIPQVLYTYKISSTYLTVPTYGMQLIYGTGTNYRYLFSSPKLIFLQ